MSVATVAQPSTPVSAFASMPSNNSATITAVQSGPYTKAQFQHTMEGSRTIKSSKEIEHLLRDYPAALELYRTGKYKVKVKCDADVERVILVEKRISKVASTNQASENQENNQTVPDINENEKEDVSQKVRSRAQSQDRAAPSVPINGNTLVPTTISSIRMTSNTQPKVEHHRTPSKDREVSVTPPQKVREQKRSQSRDNQHQGTLGKQQGKQMNYEQQKMMMPFAPNPNNPAQFWQQQQHQQQRSLQPYYSNPLLQQQQQQQARANLYMPAPFVPQQKQVCRQPYCYAPRPNIPVPYQPSQTAYPLLPPTARSIGKSSLYSNNNYSSSRSVTNTMVLPPTFRTFHSNQQCIRPFTPVFQQQVPYPVAHPWLNMSNEPISALVNPNVLPAEQQRSARNRTRSVDVSARNQSVPARSAVIQQQVASVNDHRRQQRPQIVPSAAPVAAENKDQNKETAAPAPAPTTTSTEKLTVRQLNEYFMQASTSGRVPYSSLPGIIQRFGIVLTENDVINAGKELEYNVNDPVSARRFVHILVKLGKITKSTQQVPRQPVSPSILPEDREVKDIMTQRKTTIAQNVS